MANIREELTLVDNFSGTFNQFNIAADAAIYATEAFKNALDGFTQGYLDGFVEEINKAKTEFGDAGNEVEDVGKKQKEVTDETKRTADAAGNWVNQIKSALAALGVAKMAKEFIDTADEMTLMNAKLDMINDGTFKEGQLQEEVFMAAQRSRASLSDTAALITRIGQNASDTFNNAEAIQFAENMNKSFKIAGASQQEMASATLQLSQALASGTLRGEEFNAINESAPAVIQRIADAMGVEKGQMRELAQDGMISAEIIKTAMLNATDDINKEFESIPMTWSDMMTNAQNTIQWALSDIMEQWTEFLNSAEGQQVFNDVLSAVVTFAQIGSEALMAVANAIAWVDQNWESLLPIIDMVAGAVIAYAAISIGSALASMAAWAVAHWPILLLVGAFALAINAAQNAGATFADVGNFIGRVVGVVYATVYNVVANLWNAFATFAEFLVNVFVDPISAVNNLFIGLADSVLGILESLAGAIDSVFGSNLAGAVSGWRNAVQGMTRDIVGGGISIDRMENIDVSQTSNMFGDIGANLGGRLDEMNLTLDGISNGISNIDASQFDISDAVGGNGEVGKVGKVGSIEGDVTLSDEDLKLYRDLAEQRYMNKVELQTLAPNIHVTMPDGTNLSPQDVANAIKVVLTEQMAANTATAH